MADIPPEILEQLSQGTLESGNLVEALAIDFDRLFRTLSAGTRIDPALPYTQRLRAAAQIFRVTDLPRLIEHPSDTVRGVGAYVIGQDGSLSLREVVTLVRPLAADPHFGVREWAWLGIRNRIVAEPLPCVEILQPWVLDADINIRRFATEATRPRGVWCAHIHHFRTTPEDALPLLEPCRSDPTKYVQDSVANWLNDASKTRPDWVIDIATRWRIESPVDATHRIITRALRSLNAQK